MSSQSDQQRFLELEKRQADLEKRIAELEKQAARQVPWLPNNGDGERVPYVPPRYPDNPLDPGYPGLPLPGPSDPVHPQPWGSDARCGVCWGLYKDMTHYVCTNSMCPRRVAFCSSITGPKTPQQGDLPSLDRDDLPHL